MNRGRRPGYVLLKRAFDLTSATLGLVVLSPLFLVLAIAIKVESPGPVFPAPAASAPVEQGAPQPSAPHPDPIAAVNDAAGAKPGPTATPIEPPPEKPKPKIGFHP